MVHDLQPRSPRAARAHEYAAFPKDRAVEVSDGTRVAFTVLGGGPKVPVVFVNGWTCSDGYWTKIGTAVLAAGYPAVFLDLRAHGESGLPRRPGVAARDLRAEDVSAERLARDVVEVMDAAGLDRAVLVVTPSECRSRRLSSRPPPPSPARRATRGFRRRATRRRTRARDRS